ncbi:MULTISPECIES: ATP-binding protein [unclassified Janthinobacterium]|uniref:ATP-binding protein n=1 Tax=unclassified Janthinobacterium TaxID=2610881 RepID=UPI0025B16248|nr:MULTISPECIES: ATP-binding protein [unclassified Janthinobacterium]MDN2715248.1 ATP-binding protein [Janthinobacterium sp. SUN120]MDO8037487.1 ATP-binding protein [Janthinobacterium sp. SUN137]MDO8048968.1 ATP-binding protein [Janthinobacterium sp. SUN211]
MSFPTYSPRYKLGNDVILSEATALQLKECLAKLRFRRTIYVDWNFASVDPMGLCTVINFYGPPGTGKTLSAEAVAGELGLRFLPLGIAELESKFLGDTAKNIQKAFESAREDPAVLFFDEADTLLGKRLSSVTQGVDNEVNAMRSTLLIELERFDGIVIFASNFERNYDTAFRSRIGYHIRFDNPDFAARRRLWDRLMVDGIPLGADRAQLLTHCAELSEGFSGRDIRTCMRLALPKALLAAEAADEAPALQRVHLDEAIAELTRAINEVAVAPGNSKTHNDTMTARRLLGVN